MYEQLLPLAVSVLMVILRDPRIKGKARPALLKIFREIAFQFVNDEEFQIVATNMPTLKAKK